MLRRKEAAFGRAIIGFNRTHIESEKKNMNLLFKYNSYFQNMYFLSLFILFYSSQHDFGQKKF